MGPVCTNERFSGSSDRQDNTVTVRDEAGVDPREWDALVTSMRGNFRHSHAWSRFCAKELQRPPSYFLIRRGGRAAAAGWCVISSPVPVLTGAIRQAHLEALPCFDPELISAAEVFTEVSAFAAREKCIRFSFGNSAIHYLDGSAGCRLNEKISFPIGLQASPKELHAALHQRHRERIRKAAKSGLEIRALAADEFSVLMEPLCELFRYRLIRHRAHGKESGMFDPASIGAVRDELIKTGKGVFFAAFHENRPVSCYVAGIFNAEAQLLYSASNETGYALNASFLIMWRMIEYFRERGFVLLHQGEVPRNAEDKTDIDHGLYRFKAGFGSDKKMLCSGTAVLRPHFDLLLNTMHRIKRTALGRSSQPKPDLDLRPGLPPLEPGRS